MSIINTTSFLLGFHVRYDRVVEDRIGIGPELECFSGRLFQHPQVSIQDLRIATASALIQ
jgi:hypothetical protein